MTGGGQTDKGLMSRKNKKIMREDKIRAKQDYTPRCCTPGGRSTADRGIPSAREVHHRPESILDLISQKTKLIMREDKIGASKE